jgi:hypothetical protein
MEPLNLEEIKAIRSAVKGSIDLYKGYVKLRPESAKMKRKQAVIGRRLVVLRSAYPKLK